MVRHPKPPSQNWRTFLANHMSVAAACDFFVVPSLTFKPLYCFVVLSHDRRTLRAAADVRRDNSVATSAIWVTSYNGSQRIRVCAYALVNGLPFNVSVANIKPLLQFPL